MINIRKANHNDVTAITTIFKETIQTVNAKDYSPEQIALWVSGGDDIQKWLDRIDEHYFVVTEENDQVTGWAYLSNGNYFDGLYIHKDHQGKGLATLFLKHFEEKVRENGHDQMDSDVSITALPFFEKHGFEIVRKQQKEFKGLIFENYIVTKKLQ